MATFPSINTSFGIRKTQTPKNLTVKLCDCYEQRFTVGLNQNPYTLSLSFDNITESEADTIESFFVARALDNESFDFTAPGETSSRKYVCDSHRKKIDFANRATISCTFREVFEP